MEDKQTPDTAQNPTKTSNTDIPEHADMGVEPALPPLAPDMPATPQQELPAQTKHFRLKKPGKRAILIIIAAVLVICAGSAAAYVKLKKPEKAVTTTTSRQSTKSSVAVLPKQSLTGNVLLETPLKLADLNFFADLAEEFGTDCSNSPNITDYSKCPASVKAADINYYKIGTTKANQQIIVADYPTAGDAAFQYVAIEDSPQHYAILARRSMNVDANGSKAFIDHLKAGLSSNVTLDTSSDITELNSFPDTFKIGDMNLKLPDYNGYPHGYFITSLHAIRGAYFNTTAGTNDITLAASANGTNFYSVVAKNAANYQVREFFGTKGNIYASPYEISDPKAGDKPQIVWSSGSTDVKPYTLRPTGCGSAYGYVTAKNIDGSSLKIIGHGPDNQALYELPNSSALFNEIYNDDYTPGSGMNNSGPKLSQSDFQNNHGVFLAKNSQGEYMVYMRSDLIVGGGCGKPVIYLYPQSPTRVNVKVGAEVTMSKPSYPLSGWQNVLAQPNSTLTYNGSHYPYLFWEGNGFGSYPDITSGTVVARKDVVTTIRQQLAAQGLTTKESDDFLDFWQSRLPRTPYVRLTWLDTEQMNQLAPLQISPKPTTLLRVFLDFQGLQSPKQMPSQTFHAPARNGFTVVEWGGLRRENL